MFLNLLQMILLITVPGSPTDSRLTRIKIKSVMFVITALMLPILNKKTLTMTQKGMHVMKMMTMIAFVSVYIVFCYYIISRNNYGSCLLMSCSGSL